MKHRTVEHIQVRKRVYCGFNRFIRHSIISRQTNLRIYRAVITSAETTCFTINDEEYSKLKKQQIQMLDRQNIIRYINAQGLRWFGHIQQRASETMIKKVLMTAL